MILAIDGYEANEEKRVGIGEYAYQILCYLHVLISRQHNTFVRVYLPNEPRADMPDATVEWQYFVRKPKKFWTFGALPFGIRTSLPRADVIFSPTHYVPRFLSTPRVMSIMDLSFLFYPNLFKKKDYYQLVKWTKYSIENSQAVVTISEFSRNAIIKEYNYPSDRVIVTYPGITPKKQMTTGSDIKKKYNLMNPYILSVGTVQPRKNFEKLIQAFSLLKKNKKYEDLDLVIVGKKGWLYEPILAAPEKFGVKNDVKFLDFIPDEDLPSLYSHGECFVLVSLYEGFGLPVLEAMANKCLVVISNRSSLPEIAGEAGILVEPENIESIQNGLEKALTEKSSKKSDRRIQLGLERVKMFSWEKAAKQTLEVLEKVGRGEI